MLYQKFEDNEKFYFHHNTFSEFSDIIPNMHYHNRFEIYYITDGTCTYFINNKTYNLIPGDIILIPAGTIHNTQYRCSAHSRMLINCSDKFIPSSVRPLLSQMLYLYRNPNIANEVKILFSKIEEEYQKSDDMSMDILCCYTHIFFFLLARNLNTRTQTSSRADYIEKAFEYIQNNFSSKITLSMLSDMFSVTPVHFSRIFKREAGIGFSEYLNILRLQKAESMLLDSLAESITEVANACGFSDSNYFSVKFKEMYGKSPKSLMKKR